MLRRRKPDAEIEAALAKLQIFSSLSSQDLSELAAQCLRKEYAAGVAILEEGSTGLGLFLLTSGRVEVFKQHGDRRLHLAELGRGDILGELALIDQQPRSASAVALEDTECLLLTRDRFRSLAETRPRITWALVPRLAMRNRELQDQLMAAQHSARLETASSEAASSEAMPPEIAPSEGTSPETGTTLPTAAKPSIQEAATTPMLDSEAPAEDREPPSLLQAQLALFMTGAVGAIESARLLEIFLSSFEANAGILRRRPVIDTLRAMPASLLGASMASWRQSTKIPGKMLDTLQAHLRTDTEASL